MAVLVPYDVRARLARVRSGVERGLRDVLHGGQPSWRRLPNRLPWFDQPDAEARAAALAADAKERELLLGWVRDGYVVVDGLVDPSDVDAMVARLEGLWDAPAPIPGLNLLDVRERPDAPPRTLAHTELLRLDAARRRAMRETSTWRIHGFHYHDAAAHRLFWSRPLRRLASRLFGRPARPFAAINFMVGSEQDLHQDMAVFHIYPHDFLLGAWIACEDVDAEQGPLVLHAGSHRAAMFPGFTDYPQTNLRTADPALRRAYQRWIDDVAGRYPRHEFLARKGQVLLWHGMLAHGGAPVRRPGSSRKSFVLHYSVRGADRGREVKGPFNW